MATLIAGRAQQARRQSAAATSPPPPPTDRHQHSQKQLNRIKLSRELMQRLTWALSGGASHSEQVRQRHDGEEDEEDEEEDDDLGLEQEEDDDDDEDQLRVAPSSPPPQPQRAAAVRRRRRRQKCALEVDERPRRRLTVGPSVQVGSELADYDNSQQQDQLVGSVPANSCATRSSGLLVVERPFEPSSLSSSLSIIDDGRERTSWPNSSSSNRRRRRRRRSIKHERGVVDPSHCQADDHLRQQVAPVALYCGRRWQRLNGAAICQLNHDQVALSSSSSCSSSFASSPSAAPNNGVFKYLIAHRKMLAVVELAPAAAQRRANNKHSASGLSGTKLDFGTRGESSRGELASCWRRRCFCRVAARRRCKSLAAAAANWFQLVEREIKSPTQHNKFGPSNANANSSANSTSSSPGRSSSANSTASAPPPPPPPLWPLPRPFSGPTLTRLASVALGHYNHCYYHANELASGPASSLVALVGESWASSGRVSLALLLVVCENQEIIVTCCLSWPLSCRPTAIGRVLFIATGNKWAQVERVSRVRASDGREEEAARDDECSELAAARARARAAAAANALGEGRAELSLAFISAIGRDAAATLKTVPTRRDTRFMAHTRKKFAPTSENSSRMKSNQMATTTTTTTAIDNDAHKRHRQRSASSSFKLCTARTIQTNQTKRRLTTFCSGRRLIDTDANERLTSKHNSPLAIGGTEHNSGVGPNEGPDRCATNERGVNLIIRKRLRRRLRRRLRPGKLATGESDRAGAGQIELGELEQSKHSTEATLLEAADHFYDLHHREQHNLDYLLAPACCFHDETSSRVSDGDDGGGGGVSAKRELARERRRRRRRRRHQRAPSSLQPATRSHWQQPSDRWRERRAGASGPPGRVRCLDELRFGKQRRRRGAGPKQQAPEPSEELNNARTKSVIEYDDDDGNCTEESQCKTSPCNSKSEVGPQNSDDTNEHFNETNGSARAGHSAKQANHLHDSPTPRLKQSMNSTQLSCDRFRSIDATETKTTTTPKTTTTQNNATKQTSIELSQLQDAKRRGSLVTKLTTSNKLPNGERSRCSRRLTKDVGEQRHFRCGRPLSLLIWLVALSAGLVLDLGPLVMRPLIGRPVSGGGGFIMQSSAMLTQATNVTARRADGAKLGASADELSRAVMATMSTPSSLSSEEFANSTRPLAMPQGGYQENPLASANNNNNNNGDELDSNASVGEEAFDLNAVSDPPTSQEMQISQQQQQAVANEQRGQQQTDASGGGGGFDLLFNNVSLFARIFAMVAIMIGDICGNSLVILSVVRHSKLRVTTNWFVVSLACADILVAVFAMTFNASVQITGRWIFPRWMCDFWNSCDVLTATASILHLCCISIDRYYAIMRPLDYPMKITTRRVCYALAVVWISSALLSYIPIFTGIYTTNEHTIWQREHPDQCEFVVNRVYAIVSSSISFWIPCCIMVFTYWRIYMEATRQEKFIYKAQNMLPAPQLNHHSSNHRAKQHRSKSMAVTSLSSSEAAAAAGNKKKQLEQLAKRTICEDDEQKTLAGAQSGSDSLQVVAAGATATATANSTPAEKQPLTGSAIDLNNNNNNNNNNQQQQQPVAATTTTSEQKRPAALAGKLTRQQQQQQQQQDDQDERDSNSGQSTPTKRSISKMKREHKAAKTLGIIMGVFILCWLPFFTWYTPVHICGPKCEDMVPKGFVSLLFWIGYFNSTLNPIIYAYFNHEFRDAFKKTLQWIFCCCRDLKCLRVNRPNDNQHYNCTYRSTQEIGLVTNG